MKNQAPTWFTFRVLLAICLIGAVGVIVLHVMQGISLGWLGLVGLGLVAGISYGSGIIASGFFVDTICNGETDSRHIALTFDDGPHAEYTAQVLDLLKIHNAPATFFCIGQHIEGNESILQRMGKEGHQVGNHTFTHSYNWGFFSAKKMKSELLQTESAIKNAIGATPRFFRPPFGVTTPNVKKAITELKYDVIGWNIRSLDAILTDEEKIVNRITRQLKPGGIVLMHDVQPHTVRVLKRVLEYIKTHDFTVVPLEQLINRNPYAK